MKNLFIDSNIWLSLYHFSSDDLEQFGKLKELIGTDIRLFITQQVSDEVRRNREAKLSDAFKSFEVKPIKFPVFCKEYDQYSAFNKDYKDIQRRYKEWMEEINGDIQRHSLPADKTIREFFELAGLIDCEAVVHKAYIRYLGGNPPGKDNRYGDAINWECLLQAISNGEDLYFISADKDYCSQINSDMLNPFLLHEWESKKQSHIFFYKSLVTFLNEHFTNIKLRREQMKQDLINSLRASANFQRTHIIIAQMSKESGWNESQIEEICEIAENNSQVSWILADDDVFEFYKQLLSNKKYQIQKDTAVSRVLEELKCISAEHEEQGREDWESDLRDMQEDPHYNYIP